MSALRHCSVRRTSQLSRNLRPWSQQRHHGVDASEISHFDALASEWWDPRGSSRLLHLMNPLRLQFLQSCLLRGSPIAPTESARVEEGAQSIEAVQGKDNPWKLRFLDVGCGGGILAESLARLKSSESVIALDPSKEVIGVAKQHARRDPALKGKLSYLNTTIDGLQDVMVDVDADDNVRVRDQFDVVTTMEVVEHVPDPHSFLRSCMEHVKPGGWLVGSTIARTAISYLTTKLVAEDLLNIVPRGTHDWNKYINADEMQRFFSLQPGWGGNEGQNVVFSGCAYVPGLGWKMISGGERYGNYFFGARKDPE